MSQTEQDIQAQQEAELPNQQAVGEENQNNLENYQQEQGAGTSGDAPDQQGNIAPAKGANVQLSGGRDAVAVDGPINIGMTTVDMPSEDAQRAGFHTEHASILVTQYPGVYKLIRQLGK